MFGRWENFYFEREREERGLMGRKKEMLWMDELNDFDEANQILKEREMMTYFCKRVTFFMFFLYYWYWYWYCLQFINITLHGLIYYFALRIIYIYPPHSSLCFIDSSVSNIGMCDVS